MHKDPAENLPSRSLRYCKILLLLSWTAGLILGIAFSCSTETFSSLMRSAYDSPVSIVGLVTVIVLPYLITALAVYVSKPGLLIPLAFCKAFLYGTCAAGVDLFFRSAGWLVRLLLMFSDNACMPMLFWLWLRCLKGDREKLSGEFFTAMAVSGVIGSIDYCVIAPFLASMI